MTLNTNIPSRVWQWATEAGAAGATRNAGIACRARHDAHVSLEVQLARMLPAGGRRAA